MGLDIYYLTGLVKCAPEFDSDGEILGHLWIARLNDNFPGRADELEDRACYTFEQHGDCLSLSYGGYNDWRNELARIAGYPQAMHDGKRQLRHDAGAWAQSSGPFWELINFADNEGVIGTAVCKKLAADFAQFQEKADASPIFRFADNYNRFRAGIEKAAANNGALDFS